ncbi:MAG TPA: MarR family transcriptional regulator [Noviherbaspirillum sp.]|uniref:MarR family winged helix-turn-helix transcriptional regulator n=1 Tax=Noviherbaspirillum sp. TaxID=1926288 RepID=UPI002D4D5D1E|nr:MarR family transcriptional regulator [Noviherbaspirillum sp.]HYD96981.1 MarR family transcriptional regulator [Noviherbaspirillum sp.]
MNDLTATRCNSLRLPSMAREMTQAWHAFEQFATRQLREQGLTPAQFSVLSALAGEATLSCKALGEQASITKGSLTGVVDRLEQKGLARRMTSPQDRRSSTVNLTDEGRATFERVASTHFACLQKAFEGIDQAELAHIEAGLRRIRQLFNHASR